MTAENDGGIADAGAGSDGEDAHIDLARSKLVAVIGQRIREMRYGRMTLAQLAEASNVSIGLLSRLENGVGNPSFAALSAVARALDADVDSFFESPSVGGVVIPNGDRVTLSRARTGVELGLLVPSFASRIIGVLITLAPDFAPADLVTARSGQQFEVVLDGSVRYRIEHELHELETGDFILFEAGRPHARSNLSDSTEARILSCSTEAKLESYFPPSS